MKSIQSSQLTHVCITLAMVSKTNNTNVMLSFGLNPSMLIGDVYHGDITVYGSDYCLWGSNAIVSKNLRGNKINRMFNSCNIKKVIGNVTINGLGLNNIDHFPEFITGNLCVASNNIHQIRNIVNMNIGGTFSVENNPNLKYLPTNFAISPDKFNYAGTQLVNNRKLTRLVYLSDF